MYRILRAILFLLPPESAHNVVATLLKWTPKLPIINRVISLLYNVKTPKLEQQLFGLHFRNPIGMAAGFDKDCLLFNSLDSFGFSFVEVGSLTPLPQMGNPKPRLFRLPKDRALINRMGINNRGVDHGVERLKRRRSKIVVGANIIKGTDTPNNLAYNDYKESMLKLYPFVDFFTINISCPNVKDLTQLQEIESLTDILAQLTAIRDGESTYRPILVKLSPDLSNRELDEIIEKLLLLRVDGIVATNTTTSRDNLTSSKEELESIGEGGLSGAPLFEKSLERVKYIRQRSEGKLPIVAVGGISTPQQAHQMLEAGASLIQIYTSFIYNGPSFVKEVVNYLNSLK
ncbi:MAG: quinone-dependent dihydroorotate dehydrogenase [Bacteroidales bacterium]